MTDGDVYRATCLDINYSLLFVLTARPASFIVFQFSCSTKSSSTLPQNLFVTAVILYTVSQKNPCDYVFDDKLNSKRPIVIIFGKIGRASCRERV